MKLIKNIKELKTTVLGIIVILIGCFYLFVYPYYLTSLEIAREYNETYGWIALGIGVMLILAPDILINGIIRRFFGKKEDDSINGIQ